MEVDAQSRRAGKGRKRRHYNKPNNEIAFYKTETEKLTRILLRRDAKLLFRLTALNLKRKRQRKSEKERKRQSKKDRDERERGARCVCL